MQAQMSAELQKRTAALRHCSGSDPAVEERARQPLKKLQKLQAPAGGREAALWGVYA